jgi:hypothetical protein
VTATTFQGGPGDVFAAVFEKKSGKFFARHDIKSSAFHLANAHAQKNGYIPVSITMYGNQSDPRYGAVWAANPGVAWEYTDYKNAADQQSSFDAWTRRGYRPAVIAVSPDGSRYTTVWRKDQVGGAAFHGLNAAQYQQRFDEMRAKGLYPASVDMENGVYAAVFTPR